MGRTDAPPVTPAAIENRPRCLTCRWWGREYPGACGFAETIFADNQSARLLVQVGADDDSGLYTRLLTGPAFGCVWHSSGEAANNDEGL